MSAFQLLLGLPSTGDPAIPFPTEWGRLGREGVVVAFVPDSGRRWCGNFRPGLGIVTDVMRHPDGRRVLVIAEGSIYEVDPEKAAATKEATCCVTGVYPIPGDTSLILELNHVEFVKWTATGKAWKSAQLSFDGLTDVRVADGKVMGKAWMAPIDTWVDFEVDCTSGAILKGEAISF